jgi:beta-lactam-binding protein with PASTA domain
MFSFITHRPLWLNILTGLLLALIVFLIFILSLNWLTHHNESKTVPAVVGKSFTEAQSILDKNGFAMEVQDSIYVDTAKPLSVLKQVPEDGEIIKINRTVYVVINRAVPPLVEIPVARGFSFRTMVMELTNRGLKIGDTSYKPSFDRDAVLEMRYDGQLITSGMKIPMGSSIDMVLGSGVGNEKFVVPTLVGMTFCEAKELIESHGLAIGSIIILGAPIKDTCGAYIYQQKPVKYDADGKFQYIRTGQTIDVFLQLEKPVIDSVAVPLQQPDQEEH